MVPTEIISPSHLSMICISLCPIFPVTPPPYYAHGPLWHFKCPYIQTNHIYHLSDIITEIRLFFLLNKVHQFNVSCHSGVT